MEDQKSPKIAKKFICEKCDYKCSKQYDYDKHILTLKHLKDDAEDILDDAKLAIQHFCECGKELTSNHKARHNKICPNNSKAI